MNQITQGSVISGVRFENYKGTYCSAVVITARCDLANKGKVGKVFYLCAVPLKEWVLSRKGIGIIAAKEIKNCQEKLESITKRYGLDLQALIQFSEEEVQTVLLDVKMNEQHIKELCENMRIKKEFACIKYSNSRFIELLKEDKFKKELVAKLKEIADGKNTHLCFIPRDAYNNDMCFSDGLIVDLEEIDCFTTEVKEMIEDYRIDKLELSRTDYEKWNKVFCLSEEPGYVIVDACLKSPWIEYLMQKFSYSFTRIGVDNMQKEHAQEFVTNWLQGHKEED